MARGLLAMTLAAAGAVTAASVAGDIAYTDGARNLEVALGEMMAAQNGPPPPPEVKEADDTPLRLYDCYVEYYDWEHLWTPEWKKWCCEQHRKGCPADVEAVAAPAAAAAPEPEVAPTDAAPPATTEAAATAEPTTAVATTAAPTTTNATTTTAPTTTAAPTTTTVRETCDDMCTFNGMDFSCTDRMKWALTHKVQGQKWKCFAAHDMVVKQCPMCNHCSMARGLGGTTCEGSAIQEKFEVTSLRGQRSTGMFSMSVGVACLAGSFMVALVAWRRRHRSEMQQMYYTEVREVFTEAL